MTDLTEQDLATFEDNIASLRAVYHREEPLWTTLGALEEDAAELRRLFHAGDADAVVQRRLQLVARIRHELDGCNGMSRAR